MNDADLVNRHAGPEACYTNPEQFAAAGTANYHVRDAARYDYTVTGVNEYTRAVPASSTAACARRPAASGGWSRAPT